MYASGLASADSKVQKSSVWGLRFSRIFDVKNPTFELSSLRREDTRDTSSQSELVDTAPFAILSVRWPLVVVFLLFTLRRYKLDASCSAPFFTKVSATLTYLTLTFAFRERSLGRDNLTLMRRRQSVFWLAMLCYGSAVEMRSFARSQTTADAFSCIACMMCMLISGNIVFAK